MSKILINSPSHSGQDKLQRQIVLLQVELDHVLNKTRSFEALLRSHVSDLIVESQELFILYKQIKKVKKTKRLEQKRRGKNYREPKGIVVLPRKIENTISSDQQKEKRRLYREAILHVHPDKFHMSEKETDIATEITSKLIEIYKTGNLETLQAYHAHIFNGNTNVHLNDLASKIDVVSNDSYLQQEILRLEREIDSATNSHLYKVITEYDDPLTFVDELKEYYEDRIFKLKKRTRKGL